MRSAFLSLFALVSMMLAPAGQAQAAIPDSAIVKVESGPCSHARADFRGSGLLVRAGKRVLVLTSEHVVFHGNDGYCHAVTNRELGKLSARLLAADWGNGLALLEVTNASGLGSTALPSLSELTATKTGAPVVTAGFPFGSRSPVIDDHGRVLLTDSRRHLLPTLDAVIELDGAHGEYGMSGGPVLSHDRERVLGVLSHQFLKMVAGRPSTVAEFSDADRVIQNQLIVIPADFAAAWARDVLVEGASYAPAFARDPRLQETGVDAVFTDGLRFDAEAASDNGGPGGIGGGGDGAGKSHGGVGGGGDGAGKGHGIGGGGDGAGKSHGGVGGGGDGAGKGHGIGGGGDGAGKGHGIGGGDSDSSVEGEIVIRVRLDDAQHATKFPFPRQAAKFEQMRRELLARSEVRIPLLLESTGDSRGLRKISFESLAEMFSLLSTDGMTPKIAIQRTLPGAASADPRDSRLASSLAQASSGWDTASLQPEARQLLQSAAALAAALSDGSSDADPAMIRAALGQAEGWKQLFDADFDRAVELRRCLNELQGR